MYRRWLLLLVAFAFLGAALACAYLARTPPEQGLVSVAPVHDFGELSQGQTVDCEFELVNRFAQPVTIKSVIKSCGCTVAEWPREELVPGRRVKLKAGWSVGARRGRSKVDLRVCAKTRYSVDQLDENPAL
jgi:uncharacterized protein (DUF58 family)